MVGKRRGDAHVAGEFRRWKRDCVSVSLGCIAFERNSLAWVWLSTSRSIAYSPHNNRCH